ncbi:MAG: hypothetical protein HY941_10525 [Gammaproteobacteria bacterium]|nr:hypothetical protein [Gammaproteobacteria bacterium]
MSSHALVGLVVLALVAFALGLGGLHPAAVVWRHLLFAVGVLPLILGAMLYFIPVLTRTAPAHGSVLWVPVVAAAMGVLTVVALALQPAVVPWLAAIVMLLACIETIWIWHRRNQALGGAHPGLYWYLAALLCLLLALTAVALRAAVWDYAPLLRRFHLHLNLLGFLGLTAIGTLRVLLPTVLAVSDPAASVYLRLMLSYAVIATLCIALGAAAWPPLSWLGGVIWLWPTLNIVSVVRYDRVRALGMQHAAAALAAAAVGWLLVLVAGLAHGVGFVSADTLVWLLLFLFLLPLVTGASSYLLPLWRWPGQATERHAHMRAQLMRLSGVRVLAFYLSAGLTLLQIEAAQLPAVIAVLSYLAQVVYAFLPRARDRAATS